MVSIGGFGFEPLAFVEGEWETTPEHRGFEATMPAFLPFHLLQVFKPQLNSPELDFPFKGIRGSCFSISCPANVLLV